MATGWMQGAFEGFSSLTDVPLFSLGDNPVTPLRLLIGLLMLFAVAWVAAQLERGLLRVAARRPGLNRSTFYTLSRVTRYLLWIIGTLLALHVIGVDLSAIALLTGAIGIGIGLGMQGLFNNLIGGLFLLGEKALRIGDVVTLESGVAGTLREIGLRHTRIQSVDGGEVMVPNSELVLRQVTHWTLQTARRRLHVPFQVAPDADREAVRVATLAAASQVPETLPDPRHGPELWITELHSDYLACELVVWIGRGGIERPAAARAAYLAAIADALDAAGVSRAGAAHRLRLPEGPIAVQLHPPTSPG